MHTGAVMKVARFVCPLLLFAVVAAMAQNPIPFINQPLVPDAVAPDGPAFTLTVNGTGFVSGAIVNWNGTGLVTTFVSASELTATVPATDIAIAGTGTVTVTNPTPGGGTSNIQYVSVAYPTYPITTGAAVDYSSGGFNTNSVVMADVNGDGIPDLVVVNECASSCVPFSGTGTVAVLLGNGDGTFQTAVTYGTGGGYQPDALAVADVNGDGKLDLVVANNCSDDGCNAGSVAVLLGYGDGTFQAATTFPQAGTGPNWIAVGDVNGDGKLDLMVLDACSNPNNQFCGSNVAVFLGNGDGTFQPAVTFDTGPGALLMGLAVADVNGDGKLDALVGSSGNGFGVTTGSVGVFLGNGDGTFQNPVSYSSGAYEANSMAVADVNGDSKLDLLVANSVGCGAAPGPDPCLSVLLGNGDGTFQNAAIFDSVPGSNSIHAADINADGRLDAVLAGGSPLSAMLGNGNGTFQAATVFGSGQSGLSSVADVNRDGKPDFIALAQSAVSIVLNTSPLVTNTSLASSRNPSSFGQAVTFTATVTAQNGGTPAGTATFYDGTTNIGGSNLNSSGVATFTTSTLAAGTHSMTATYNGNATFGTSTAPVLNQVVQGAVVSLSPSNLDFGSQPIGIPSTPQGVTLQNTGNVNLAIVSIQVVGANHGDFAQNNNCPTLLSGGSSCNINVTFTPSAAGTRNTTLSVSDNAPGSPQSAPLTGVGLPSGVGFSPAEVDFPAQYVGTSGLPQTLTVTNNGSVPLVITRLTTSIADFGTLANCTNAVPPGMNCTIGVFFDPTASGSRSATLQVTDNASGSPQSVPLHGTGQDFSMASSGSDSATISPGGTATYQLAVAPAGGFKETVSFACTGAPAGFVCSVPGQVTLNGSSTTTVTVTVSGGGLARLTRPVGFTPVSRRIASWLAFSSLPGLLILVGAGTGRRRIHRIVCGLACLCLLALTILWTGCGGRGGSAGSYSVTVTGSFTSGGTTLTHDTVLTLVVQ